MSIVLFTENTEVGTRAFDVGAQPARTENGVHLCSMAPPLRTPKPVAKPANAAARFSSWSRWVSVAGLLVPLLAAAAQDCSPIQDKLAAEEPDEPPSEEQIRAVHATALMHALEAAGMKRAPGVEVRLAAYGGLGLFAVQGAKAGDIVASLPSSLMLGGAGDNAEPLAALILRERRQPSTELRRLYMATLPTGCSPNLALRSDADLAAVEASLHRERVDAVRREISSLAEVDPPPSLEERRWAVCIKLSRSFEDRQLEPFIDLINYSEEPSCIQAMRRPAGGATEARHEIHAARELLPGDEITLKYLDPARCDRCDRRKGVHGLKKV